MHEDGKGLQWNSSLLQFRPRQNDFYVQYEITCSFILPIQRRIHFGYLFFSLSCVCTCESESHCWSTSVPVLNNWWGDQFDFNRSILSLTHVIVTLSTFDNKSRWAWLCFFFKDWPGRVTWNFVCLEPQSVYNAIIFRIAFSLFKHCGIFCVCCIPFDVKFDSCDCHFI